MAGSAKNETTEMQDLSEQSPGIAKDFDTLVTASSDAQAYRPEEVEPTETGLDLERLAEALEAVPLYERLALPRDLLLPKQIAEFEHNAAQRLKAFEEKLKSIVTADIEPDPAHDDLQQVNWFRRSRNIDPTLMPRDIIHAYIEFSLQGYGCID